MSSQKMIELMNVSINENGNSWYLKKFLKI